MGPATQTKPGVMSGLVGMLNVFVDPGATARRVPAKLSWLWPLITISIIYVVFGYLLLPYTAGIADAAIAERVTQQGLRPEQVERAQTMARMFSRIAVAFTPLFLIVITLILAWLVSVMGSITGARAKFRDVFSLMAACSLIPALQYIAAFVVVRVKGDEVHSVEQLTPPFGLDIFLQDLHGVAFAVVNFFSIFEVWYIVVLTVGLSYLTKSTKAKAFVTIAPAWMLQLLLRVIQVSLAPGGRS
ncbi:MAG TPA: YIP1 family protein [Bryobacteraceae bacterium]|nr:YIP1 family protein [Bryobacteraceae bacterium]